VSEDSTFTQEDMDAAIAEAVASAEKGLKANRDKALKEAKAAKAKLNDLQSEFEGLTASVAELKQAAAAADAGVGAEQLQEMRTQIRADMDREYAPHIERVEALKGTLSEKEAQIRQLLLVDRVKADMVKAGAKAERADALFTLTQDRYDLDDTQRPFLKDSRETPLADWFKEELADEYPEFWNGSGSSGGGASKSAGGAGGDKIVIAADDEDAFIANVEAIAKGEAVIK
jgi:hypothetical protein